MTAPSGLEVPMTATAGTPTGTVGVKRTAGTSLTLDGETASSGAATDKAIWEFNLPTTYIAGANIPIVVNANYTGAGTPTAGTTTITDDFRALNLMLRDDHSGENPAENGLLGLQLELPGDHTKPC